jgi:FKBP-type peptidyl-prolyl cis-trans isomerase
MKRIGQIALVLLLVSACKTEGVEKESKKSDVQSDLLDPDVRSDEPEEAKTVKKEITLKDGLKIKWFEQGSGGVLKPGELVRIDYTVKLKNGEIIDGNHLNNKAAVPFMPGFGMQTEGWDMAFKELKVGDQVEVFIPSKLARGEKAVPGLFPANSDNILTLRIVERMKPTRETDGNKVWIFEENKKNKVFFGEGKSIEFHAMAFTPSSSLYLNTFRDNKPFTMQLEDYGLVPGLKKSLINAKKADRMFVYVPASEAYGSKGYLDLVKPNEAILYNIMIMDVSIVSE